MVELFYFLLILIVIIFAYGVSTQALMFQKQEFDFYLLEKVFFSGYFILFGTNPYSEMILISVLKMILLLIKIVLIILAPKYHFLFILFTLCF